MAKTIRGIVTWLKDWFYGKDYVDSFHTTDTGWTGFSYRELEYDSSGYYCHIMVSGTTMKFYPNNVTTYLKDYWTNQPIRIRKLGKIVHIEGAMTNELSVPINNSTYFPLQELTNAYHNNSSAYSNGNTFPIGTLSEEFRPSSTIRSVQQASGKNTYLLIINTDGVIAIGRHGTSSYANTGDNPWLNFNITYTVG